MSQLQIQNLLGSPTANSLVVWNYFDPTETSGVVALKHPGGPIGIAVK